MAEVTGSVANSAEADGAILKINAADDEVAYVVKTKWSDAVSMYIDRVWGDQTPFVYSSKTVRNSLWVGLGLGWVIGNKMSVGWLMKHPGMRKSLLGIHY